MGTFRSIFIIVIGFLIAALIVVMAFKQWSFDTMMQGMLSKSVELKSVEQNELDNYLILDVRAEEEFEVSHLPGAVQITPESTQFDESILNSEKPVLVYCSVGLRSEKLGERLQQANPDLKVFNLNGGIFQWSNQEKKLVDSADKPTKSVHTYNAAWSFWVSKGEKVY